MMWICYVLSLMEQCRHIRKSSILCPTMFPGISWPIVRRTRSTVESRNSPTVPHWMQTVWWWCSARASTYLGLPLGMDNLHKTPETTKSLIVRYIVARPTAGRSSNNSSAVNPSFMLTTWSTIARRCDVDLCPRSSSKWSKSVVWFLSIIYET